MPALQMTARRRARTPGSPRSGARPRPGLIACGALLAASLVVAPASAFELAGHPGEQAAGPLSSLPATRTAGLAMLGNRPSLRIPSPQYASYFGASVATAGDVNGDGYSDVIVGSPWWDPVGTYIDDWGQVSIYLGAASGLSTSPAWTVSSPRADAYLGFSAACAGDVNNDGYDDVIIGAWGEPNSLNQANAGRAYLYLGGPGGPSTTPAWSDEGSTTNTFFGRCVAGLGDADGDGFADVVVGDGQNVVWIYSGDGVSLTLTAGGLYWPNGGSFGYSVAGAGDVNRDGFDDLIVGAPDAPEPGKPGAGAAYVFLSNGTSTPYQFPPDYTYQSGQANAHAGWSVATAGDINGDGYADALVGVPGYDWNFGIITLFDAGDVVLLPGSASGINALEAFSIGQIEDGAGAGSAVATAGDVNGDGRADVVANAGPGSSGYGSVNLFGGRATGFKSASLPDTTIVEVAPFSGFGQILASAGDVNGDGFGDFVVGSPSFDTYSGLVTLFYGGPSLPDSTDARVIAGDVQGGLIGNNVVGAGDVNGDGYDDLLMESADALVSPNSSQGWLFYGGDGGPPAIPDWASPREGTSSGLIAPAGDVNGDGYDDVVETRLGDFGGRSRNGMLRLFLGSATGLATSPAWSWIGTADSTGDHRQLSPCIGDVNGDGFADVIVGEPFFSNGQSYEGRVLAFLGSLSGFPATPSWTAEGDTALIGFGSTVMHAGDGDGDGYGDVFVAAPSYWLQGGLPGRCYLYRGGPAGLQATPAWEAFEAATGLATGPGRFGMIAATGDFDGDGFGDLVVQNAASSTTRKLHLWRGGPANWPRSPSQTFTPSGYSIGCLARVGDLDLDGRDDLALSGNSFTRVFMGSSGGIETTPRVDFSKSGSPAGFVIGLPIVRGTLGSLDGSGFTALAVPDAGASSGGLTNNGRVFLHPSPMGFARPSRHDVRQASVAAPIAQLGITGASQYLASAQYRTPAGLEPVRLRQETKPYGVPFDGVGTTVTDWNAPLLKYVSLPQNNTAYQWRQRLETRSPFFPRSPWVSPQGNGVRQYDLRRGSIALAVTPPPAGSTSLGEPWPNPSADGVHLRFSIASAGAVRITIHDIAGREVARIADGPFNTGGHVTRWDGRLASGNPAAAGIYFVRLLASGQQIARRVVLVR